MNKTASYALARLREPSTLAALSALAVLFGMPPGTVDLAAQVIGGAAALVAAALPDTKPAAPQEPTE